MNDDIEFSNYSKTYKKITAVEDVQEQNYLIEVFANCWKRKFKSMPLFSSTNYHFTQMKDFRKIAGPKAGELIQHYFEMKDEWFEKQGFSLDCLCKNLNKVNASYSVQQHNRESRDNIEVPFHCDACWKPFQLIVPKHYDFNLVTKCVGCIRDGKPLKTVTKEQRKQAIIKFGGMFLNMPKNSDYEALERQAIQGE